MWGAGPSGGTERGLAAGRGAWRGEARGGGAKVGAIRDDAGLGDAADGATPSVALRWTMRRLAERRIALQRGAPRCLALDGAARGGGMWGVAKRGVGRRDAV